MGEVAFIAVAMGMVMVSPSTGRYFEVGGQGCSWSQFAEHVPK
jgi:hypothetical protein